MYIVGDYNIRDNIIATTPSLRDTSPQGEAFIWLPLRGAVATATEGWYLLSVMRATNDCPTIFSRNRRNVEAPFPTTEKITPHKKGTMQ